MSCTTSRGGSRPLRYQREFQLLELGVQVHTDDADMARQLEFFAQDAHQPVAPRQLAAYTVDRAPGGYRILEGDRAPDFEAYGGGVVTNLFRRAHRRAFELLAPRMLVRAAVGSWSGVRFMIVARPGAGLSCLAVRLLHDGAQVEGDALAVLADGHVTAFPRPFYLRDSALAVVPELAERFHELPCLESHGGGRTWAYHPDALGRAWQIRAAPVDVIVQLEPYHGASTRLVPVAAHAMAQIVTSCSMPRPGAGGELVRELAQLLRGPQALRLQMGALEDGAVALRRIVC